jgi:hypothetical protein
LKHVATATPGRLIGFTVSGEDSYLLHLSSGKIQIWKEMPEGFELLTFGAFNDDFLATPYNNYDVWSLQYAQYYDRMYFASRRHKQRVLLYSSGSFSFAEFSLVTDFEYGDTSNMFGRQTGYYPGVVAVCANRLWYASTDLQPFTMWASRPYENDSSHSNFQTYDRVTVETEVLKPPAEWPTKDDGHGNTIYDLDDPNALLKVITETNDVITARCGMQIELASGRNDRIMWISAMNNILVGTEASEWMLPYDIDPTKQSASMVSSYGSLAVQPDSMHSGVFFLQRGNRLREFVSDQNGLGSHDLSFHADHMISQSVRQMVCMRNPDPTVFLLLNDGKLVVLCYDKNFDVQGWSRWETAGTILSIATKENASGQELFALVQRGSTCYLERFDYSEKLVFKDRLGAVVDKNLDYDSLLIGNRFDFLTEGGTSIGRSKKASEVWLRCLDTGVMKVGVEEKSMQSTNKAVGSSDYKVTITGGARKELQVRVQSVGGDPITLLAMTYEVEVN